MSELTNAAAMEKMIENRISDTPTEKLKKVKSRENPKISVGWEEKYSDEETKLNLESYKSAPLTGDSIEYLIERELEKRDKLNGTK